MNTIKNIIKLNWIHCIIYFIKYVYKKNFNFY